MLRLKLIRSVLVLVDLEGGGLGKGEVLVVGMLEDGFLRVVEVGMMFLVVWVLVYLCVLG